MSITPLLYPLAKLFHVCLRDHGRLCFLVEPGKPWGGNLRAVCDAAVRHPNVKQILILNAGTTASTSIAATYQRHTGKRVEILSQRLSLKNLFKVLRASHVFLEEYKSFGLPNCKVNLWHGIPIKKMGVFQTRIKQKNGRTISRPVSARKLNQHDFLIASSMHDAVVMSACFQMTPDKVLNSGLPRNDWLDYQFPLPPDLQQQFEKIEQLKAGRKLLLYTPTFRDKQKDFLPLSVDEIKDLIAQLKQHNAVLGLRLHPVSEGLVQGLSSELGYLDFSSLKFPEVQLLLKATDVLLTDYSSTCLDFCLTGKPSISYCPDLAEYSRGFLYPLETVFPGPIAHNLLELKKVLGSCLNSPDTYKDAITRSQQLFHEPGRNQISHQLLNRLLNGPAQPPLA